MSQEDSVSEWIEGIKAGDDRAAAELWQRYFTRLTLLASRKLPAGKKRVTDEEDVVIDVFDTLCRNATQGKFPALKDRDDLWALLVKITERKAWNQQRDGNRQRRGGGQVRGDSALGSAAWGDLGQPYANPPPADPTPEFAAMMRETVESLLGDLDDELRKVVVMKMEGHRNDDIASAIGRSLATVERRLKLVRTKWEPLVT